MTYTGTAPGTPLFGSWQSVDLTQSATNSTQWSGTFTDTGSANPADDAQFMVQAVNGVGLVALDNNGTQMATTSRRPSHRVRRRPLRPTPIRWLLVG